MISVCAWQNFKYNKMQREYEPLEEFNYHILLPIISFFKKIFALFVIKKVCYKLQTTLYVVFVHFYIDGFIE